MRAGCTCGPLSFFIRLAELEGIVSLKSSNRCVSSRGFFFLNVFRDVSMKRYMRHGRIRVRTLAQPISHDSLLHSCTVALLDLLFLSASSCFTLLLFLFPLYFCFLVYSPDVPIVLHHILNLQFTLCVFNCPHADE